MQDNQSSHMWLLAVQNERATLGDSLTVSDKITHIPTKCNSSHTPTYLPEKNDNLCSHKNVYQDVYSSFMHSHQNLKQLGCPSVGEWINEPWYVYTLEY